YEKHLLKEVVNNFGQKLQYYYTPENEKVKKVVGPNKTVAYYETKGEDLVWVKNAFKEEYHYTYDNAHNMVRVDFPDKTFKLFEYDKKMDWVIKYKDRKGCTEFYKYVNAKQKVLSHYSSSVIKKCKGKVTNKSVFHFFMKKRPDGNGRYLYKITQNINGKKSETIYHPVFGKAIAIKENNKKTTFQYYKNGLLKRKKSKFQETLYFYENKCQKVSKVITKYFKPNKSISQQANRKSRKPAKLITETVTSYFKYDPHKCNLLKSYNSLGQKVYLSYDIYGRISKVKDQSKKEIKIKYDLRTGKPLRITRSGLGTLTISYDKNGKIKQVKSKEGPLVAVQIANLFNNLLEMITPAMPALAGL
ncbi:MAG: cell wall-associated protein wapA, partial [Bdellovibrio sp.]